MSDDRHRDDPRDRVDFGTPRGGTALGGLHWRQLGLFVAAAVWALAWTRATSGPGARVPAHLADIRILAVATDRGTIGLVRDGARLVAILEVTPEPMMLAGSAEMAGRRAAWGATLAGLARPGSAVVRVQWLARTAAVGPRARGQHVDTSLRERLPDPAVQSYLDFF